MNYNSETTFLAHKTKTKILDVLKDCFSTCEEFYLSVSFIKESGLVLLKKSIENALDRGASGTIVTCDYMHITEVESLKYLLELQEKYPKFKAYFIKLANNPDYKSFHTKGYVFKNGSEANIIVGSSNLSGTAISQDGGEWSLYSKTDVKETLFADVLNEFDFNIGLVNKTLDNEDIKGYVDIPPDVDFGAVNPNYMQKEALKELDKTRKNGQKRALVIAAMGSGKTLLSAFDVRNYKAKRVLYVCHSETILRKAKIEYELVFGTSKTYGFCLGGEKSYKSDIIFATNVSLYRHLSEFNTKDFDYLIFDEAHHVAADTFLAIYNYFEPDFMLGMTGTPDRLDQQNVRALFGNTIPYELSLRDAIKYNLIMPFKYYSVFDDNVDYSTKSSESALLKQMIDVNHGIYIKNKINEHIHEINGKIKCLAFCINIMHAKEMARLMAQLGYVTEVITGSTPDIERRALIDRIQDESDPLQILFTINVFNEGIDIPKINMTLFLRPTESSTIFIQQLGRSLRIAENKNKPVIIDFIGKKYERSTYIAWALGSLVDAPVLTKPILKEVLHGNYFKEISDIGVEINVDDKSKQEIDQYLDDLNFNTLSILRRSYEDFKKFYNCSAFPQQCDFVVSSSNFDLLRIIAKQRSYYNFLKNIKEFNVPTLTKEQNDFIIYLSEMLPLTRTYEYRIIDILLEEGPKTFDEIKDKLKGIPYFKEETLKHALNYLLREYDSEISRNSNPKYVCLENNKYILKASAEAMSANEANGFTEVDFNDADFRYFIIDTLRYGILHFENERNIDGEFEPFKTYSRKEFTRIARMNSVYSFQPGVIYTSEGMLGLFIDLVKKENVEEHLNYGDKFLSKNTFEWESQTETVIGNNRYNKLVSFDKADIFVRKFQSEDTIALPYVYLGKGKLSNPRETKNEKHTVLFDITLDKSLTDELFEQFNISDDTPRDEGNTADVNVTQNPTDIIKIDFKKIIGASSGNGTHMICTNCKHSDGNSCDLAKVAKATPTECPNFENKES